MITGSSSAAQILPGNPGEISRVVETVGAGIAPARAVSAAWQSMTIPQWKGRAATQWAAFTPRERGRTAKAPTALNRVSSAMMRYQAAFTGARAEIDAAIADAAAAERTTTAALSEHREATRKAALADPGTPEATVAAFSDPGATALAAANSRATRAKTQFDRQGDEIASEIRAASLMASGVRPSVMAPPGHNPDIDLARGAEFWKGFSLQAWDEIVALLKLAVPLTDAPEQFAEFLEYFTDRDAWEARQQEKAELFKSGEIWHQLANALIGWDDWVEGSPESAGRLTVLGLTWLIPVTKLGRLSRLGELGRLSAAGRMKGLLKNSSGVTVEKGRVLVRGVDRMSLTDLDKLYKRSVHNMNAKQATLGRYIKDDPSSYERTAQRSGDAHFNLKDPGWNDAKQKYGVTDGDLYELLNKPFLDEVIQKGIPVRFSSDPTLRPSSALGKELDYLNRHGYEYDPKSMFARPIGK